MRQLSDETIRRLLQASRHQLEEALKEKLREDYARYLQDGEGHREVQRMADELLRRMSSEGEASRGIGGAEGDALNAQ